MSEHEAAMIRVVVYIIAVASVIGAVSAGDVDIDAILGDEDLLQEMVKCFMADSDEGCDDQAKKMKGRLHRISSRFFISQDDSRTFIFMVIQIKIIVYFRNSMEL